MILRLAARAVLELEVVALLAVVACAGIHHKLKGRSS